MTDRAMIYRDEAMACAKCTADAERAYDHIAALPGAPSQAPGWNFDISQAPKGETRKVMRGDKEFDQHFPVRIIAAGNGKVVTISQWNPKTGAWSMFTKECPPLAWMPWPEHQGEQA